MAEEFQESDVFWPEESHRREDRPYYSSVFQDDLVIHNNSAVAVAVAAAAQLKKINKKRSFRSVPVTIPSCNAKQRSYNTTTSSLQYWDSNGRDNDDDDDGEELKDAEMVPPHLVVAARFRVQMAFSLCSATGRTQKGREMSRVRDSILKMTGFIEA